MNGQGSAEPRLVLDRGHRESCISGAKANLQPTEGRRTSVKVFT